MFVCCEEIEGRERERERESIGAVMRTTTQKRIPAHKMPKRPTSQPLPKKATAAAPLISVDAKILATKPYSGSVADKESLSAQDTIQNKRKKQNTRKS